MSQQTDLVSWGGRAQITAEMTYMKGHETPLGYIRQYPLGSSGSRQGLNG